MSQARCALVVFCDGEFGVDGTALTSSQRKMESGRVVRAAAKTLAVVRPKRRTRRWRIGMTLRRNSVSRRLRRSASGHGRTLPTNTRSIDARLIK